MTLQPPVVKRFPIDRTDRVGVLNELRAAVGPLVPEARRLDAETASFDWIHGDVPATEADLPDDALLGVGQVLARVHSAGRGLAPPWGLTSIAQLPGTIARLHSSAATLGVTFDLRPEAPEWTMTWTHGDIAPANIVFHSHGWDVAGVIDWEFMAWDLPILDVAHALWRTAGWSNWKTDAPDWGRRSARTATLLDGYGWTGPSDDLLIALQFLLERRVEVIVSSDAAAPGTLPPDWVEELERCRCDLEIIGSDVDRYRALARK